jgi:hypothetical protein
MTTEYKLLLNDVCTFTPLGKDEKDDVLRFEIKIAKPKNLTAYETWNRFTPKANAGTAKIFGIAPTVLVNSIENYDINVQEVRGFKYKPTASAILGDVAPESDNQGGLLVLDSLSNSWDNDKNEPILTILAHSRHGPVLDDLLPFPTEPFNGKIRMNINGFQSTSMLNVVDDEFIQGWLKPTYDKLEPYPYIDSEVLEDPDQKADNRVSPSLNFAYGGYVSVKNSSYGKSQITITDPLQALQYQVWNPLTPFENRRILHYAEIVPLSNVYSIFVDSKKDAMANGLPVNEYAWQPIATFDLIDQNGKSNTYIGKIVNITSELGEPNQAPKIIIDVDTNNFELYKNKRLPALPSGDFFMIMDIDGGGEPGLSYWLKAMQREAEESN